MCVCVCVCLSVCSQSCVPLCVCVRVCVDVCVGGLCVSECPTSLIPTFARKEIFCPIFERGREHIPRTVEERRVFPSQGEVSRPLT